VTSVSVNGTTILSSALYEPFGPVAGWTWGNGTYAVRSYDTDGKVSQVDSAGLRTYGYDNAFRITGITDTVTPANSWTYGYDPLDRLTSAVKTGTTRGWTYDANGNRLTQSGTSAHTVTVSSTNNRVSSISGGLSRTYAYDAAGNTTGYGNITYTYGNRGRLTSFVVGSTTSNYLYDALGQRIRRSGGGGTTIYMYDESGHLLGEYDSAGALVQETVWLGDIPVATLRPKTGGGVDIFYVHTDHLNTPRKVTRPSDNKLRWTWEPDPFGVGTPNQNPQSLGTFVYNLRFPGQVFEAQTGLNYNYFRDYDPAVGRYIESDPIGLEGGWNTYAYVGDNPVSQIDPMGLAVYICRRAVDIDWIPGGLAGSLPKHHWLKTDTREAGMGGRCPVPGQECSDHPYSETEVKDHTGQSKMPGVVCELQRNVDESCVNRQLVPGRPTGPWNIFNQCNSFAYSVVGNCRYGPQFGGPLPPGALRQPGPLGRSFGPRP